MSTSKLKKLPPLLPEDRKLRIAVLVAIILLMGAFVIRLCDTIPGNSATYDESVHVTRGYAALRLHDLRLNIEHPVLGDALAALPLLTDHNLRFPVDSQAWHTASHWVVADLFLWHANLHPQLLINQARYAVAVMSMALALLVLIWSAELYGWKGAVLSLVLYTFCPTILANSSLATNDISVSLFSVLYLWLLWLFVRHPSVWRGLAASVVLGAALMCKYSATLLLVDTAALLLWWWWRTGSYGGLRPGRVVTMLQSSTEDQDTAGINTPGRRRRSTVAGSLSSVVFQAGAMVLGAGVVVWGVYGFRLNPVITPAIMQEEVGQSLELFIRGKSSRPDTSLIREPDQVLIPIQPLPHNFRWKVLTRYPLPAPQYLRGFIQNLMQAKGGHRAYLLGHVSRTGWWHYFPVAFLVKTPIPYLLLMGLAFLSLRRGGEWDEAFLLLPGAVIFLIAMKAHIDIGIRHLAPLYPLLAIFCGRLMGVVEGLSASGKWSLQKTGAAVIGFLCFWFGMEGAAIHPLYLAYFNELAGGPTGGSRFLVDSNLDWGQDLIRLNCELRKRKINLIALCYFGTAEPTAYGIAYQPVDPSPAQPPKPGTLPIYGWIAVSVSNLGYYSGPGEGLAWLKAFQPLFTVGHTIRVYHIPIPRVKKHEVHKIMHSDQMLE